MAYKSRYRNIAESYARRTPVPVNFYAQDAEAQQQSPATAIGGAIGNGIKNHVQRKLVKEILAKEAGIGTSSAAAATPYGTINSAVTGEAIGTAGFVQGAPGASIAAPYGTIANPITGQAIGTAGPPAAGASLASYAGPAIGAYGLYDLIKNKRGEKRGGLQGAASGAALGSFGGPIGAGIGAVIGGAFGAITGHKKKTDTEMHRFRALKEAGDTSVTDEEAYTKAPYVDKGQSIRPDLPDDFVGYDDAGNFVNNRYSRLRDDKELHAQDITSSAALRELYPGFMKLSTDEKNEIAKYFVDRGLVTSKKGSFVIDTSNPFDELYILKKRWEKGDKRVVV